MVHMDTKDYEHVWTKLRVHPWHIPTCLLTTWMFVVLFQQDVLKLHDNSLQLLLFHTSFCGLGPFSKSQNGKNWVDWACSLLVKLLNTSRSKVTDLFFRFKGNVHILGVFFAMDRSQHKDLKFIDNFIFNNITDFEIWDRMRPGAC